MTLWLIKWNQNLASLIPYTENKISTSNLTFDTSFSYIIRLTESLLRYIDQKWSMNRFVEIITFSFDELNYFTSKYYFRHNCKTSDYTCNNERTSIFNDNQIKTLGIRKFNTFFIHFNHFDINVYNLIVLSWQIAIWNISVSNFYQHDTLPWNQFQFRTIYKFLLCKNERDRLNDVKLKFRRKLSKR